MLKVTLEGSCAPLAPLRLRNKAGIFYNLCQLAEFELQITLFHNISEAWPLIRLDKMIIRLMLHNGQLWYYL